MLSAPDLMLTQLLVEVLMTVFLALSLRLLMRHPIAPPKKLGPRLGQMWARSSCPLHQGIKRTGHRPLGFFA